jgi:DNA topoisomerase-1
VEVGKDTVGLITYMRTDSTRVSDDAIRDVRDFIGERYGREFLPDSANFYKSKKGAQDAHEAIRPTSMAYAPEVVDKYLQEDERKVYRLIWNRFVASQMMPALYDQTTIDVGAKGKKGDDYLFRATGSVLKFEGFLKVYQEGKDQIDEEDEEMKHRLPAVAEGERLRFKAIRPEQHFTEPPPRYNEATLVKRLEADGVGRPSTYASILSTIQEREYVKKDAGRFTPTELGMVVTDLLLESFDDIFDVTYTARMEEELDEIEDGKIDWRVAMQEFYERFDKDLKHAEEHMTDIKRMEKPTDLTCEKCGKPLVIKWGKHGSFIACTGYPECTYTRELTVDLPDVDKADLAEQGDEEYCENCGRPMVLKKGRFGTFYACTGYPDCKTTKPIGGAQKKPDQKLDEICPQCGNHLVLKTGRFGEFTACSNYPTCKYVKQKTIGVKCPECSEGEIVERRSKRGKTFYGCNRWPECNFVAWGKPVPEKCPECGSPYMIEKWLKAGTFWQCPNAECKHKQPAPQPVESGVQ